MSKKRLNATIRNMVTAYIQKNGKTMTVKVIDYIIDNLPDPRVTRQRVSGNISALCCKFNMLTCVNSQLIIGGKI